MTLAKIAKIGILEKRGHEQEKKKSKVADSDTSKVGTSGPRLDPNDFEPDDDENLDDEKNRK